MLNNLKKISRDVKGFTLTEVMIGMMILTVAIVSATNLLTGIIDSNRDNLTTLQAYYLSQEGLEMVRNIRDTNWLHNRDWLGASSAGLWGDKFEIPNKYAVNLSYHGMTILAQETPKGTNVTSVMLAAARPWIVQNSPSGAKIYRHAGVGTAYFDSDITGRDTGFKRTIILKQYDCKYLPVGLCADGKYVLVQSEVEWDLGAKHRDFVLSEVLTNWKGGAL